MIQVFTEIGDIGVYSHLERHNKTTIKYLPLKITQWTDKNNICCMVTPLTYVNAVYVVVYVLLKGYC